MSDSSQKKTFSILQLQKELHDLQERNQLMVQQILFDQQAQEYAINKPRSKDNNLQNPHKEALIKGLYLENEQLKFIIENMTKDRNFAQSKAILIQQQSQENENFKSQMSQELESKLYEVTKSLMEKESVIQQIEQNKNQGSEFVEPSSSQDTTQMIVHRDVVIASASTHSLHEDTESLKREIQILVEQIDELQKQRKSSSTQMQQLKFILSQLDSSMLSSSIKKSNCLIEEENYFSDDEDFNLSKCKKRIGNFFREKLRAQVKEELKAQCKQNSLISNFNVNSTIANAITHITIGAQRSSQIEVDIEKYKLLGQTWLENSKKKVEQIKKINRYNQTLEKSNKQLIENYNNYQRKISAQTENLNTFKDSYHKLQTIKSSRQKSSSSLTTLFRTKKNSLASIQSTDVFTSTTIINKQGEEKELKSVYEEEIDEDITMRKTLTKYSSAGLRKENEKKEEKENEDRISKYQPQNNNKQSSSSSFPTKKNCQLFLYKLKQSIDRISSIISSMIYTQEENIKCQSQTSLLQLKIKRSLSDCTDSISESSKDMIWSQNKMKIIRTPLIYKEKEESNSMILLDPPSSVEEIQMDIFNKDFFQPQIEEENYKQQAAIPTQLNTSYFKELDISIIQKSKKIQVAI